jgi:hypothetical protein
MFRLLPAGSGQLPQFTETRGVAEAEVVSMNNAGRIMRRKMRTERTLLDAEKLLSGIAP